MFTKIQKENLSKFIKIFELYQIFIYNFLCQNGKIFTKAFGVFTNLCVVKYFSTTDAH